jgi:putative nucleotidyltransferase with HDIG domain
MRRDGTVIPIELSSRIIEYNGEPVALSIARDITERKQAEEERKQSFERLQRALQETVNALASALEMRDPYTAGHQRRVADLACIIAREMGLSDEQVDGIRLAGIIHDVGKIRVPGEILSWPGKLTEIDFNIIKVHPQVGYDILKTIEFPYSVAEIMLQHHERMDGSGYPSGLKDGEILQEARILAVADVVEAMASHRPYRPSRGINKALAEITKNKNVLYDPDVVDACLKLFKENKYKFK